MPYGLDYLGIWCSSYILVFFIQILVAVWIYRDAEERGMSGVLWAILVILFGLLPLIIYLVVRKPKAEAPSYPSYSPYGYPPAGGQSYQQQYEQPQAYYRPSHPNFCRECGKKLPSGDVYDCPSCGARI
ncbi:MAG: hypothetical protein ACE5KV_03850 [Thermoplasmata archaeon]